MTPRLEINRQHVDLIITVKGYHGSEFQQPSVGRRLDVDLCIKSIPKNWAGQGVARQCVPMNWNESFKAMRVEIDVSSWTASGPPRRFLLAIVGHRRTTGRGFNKTGVHKTTRSGNNQQRGNRCTDGIPPLLPEM